MNTATQDFGRRLRVQRERLGISLEAIAASTKIARSLLADLERGNLSKWPGGIYRRAFFREYAVTIGLPADARLAEFLDLFPDDEAAPAGPRSTPVQASNELRLTLVEDRTEELLGSARRLLVAVAELCLVLGAAWLLSWVSGFGFWTACATTALTYYPVAAFCSIRVPAFRLPALRRRISVADQPYAVPSSRALIQLVLHQTPVQGADERTA